MTPLSLDSLKGPHIETFERSDSLFDWRLVATNGEIVCSSSQGFADRGDAERAADRAKELFGIVTETRSV